MTRPGRVIQKLVAFLSEGGGVAGHIPGQIHSISPFLGQGHPLTLARQESNIEASIRT